MTSRRSELGDLIRSTLCDSVGQAQPPAYVWKRIERKVQRHRAVQAGRYTDQDGFCQPMTFSVWESRVPLSLIYVIEQTMPMRGFGWAT
jgi:hypothetical protein